MENSEIIITKEYEQCFDLIDSEVAALFISGQAGTGKSVLIDVLSERYGHDRKVVRVAPTGVTALNINGQTLHSLFKLPLGLLIEDNKLLSALSKIRKFGGSELLETIDLIIMDEVSMIRPDYLDAIDFILKAIRGVDYPFGGVQVVFVGDMFQLPPVITNQERQAFEYKYGTDYFFGSRVVEELFTIESVEVVHLTQTFRQKDPLFINILNDIRVNKSSSKNIKILNEYCHNSDRSWNINDENSIMLCTTNRRADVTNKTELQKLDSPSFKYHAIVEGKFTTKLVTPTILELKVGAKVMFTKNNPGEWVNGTLGTIISLNETEINVRIAGYSHDVTVDRDTWENIQYNLDKSSDGKRLKNITENIVGKFQQFPLTLAYSLTIHKSQGLTFDNVCLDLGEGCFTSGQVYVALSRCTNIDGIALVRPIEIQDVYVDSRIVDFYNMLLPE